MVNSAYAVFFIEFVDTADSLSYNKELCRNKLCEADAGFFDCSEAANRRNTLCISRFDNEATDKKDKPDCTSYFGTVPKLPDE